MKLMYLMMCLVLAGCDLSPPFWEKEGEKVVEDIVEEEENHHP